MKRENAVRIPSFEEKLRALISLLPRTLLVLAILSLPACGGTTTSPNVRPPEVQEATPPPPEPPPPPPMESTVLRDRLQELYDRNPPSSWTEADSLDQLKEMTTDLAHLLHQAAGQEALQLEGYQALDQGRLIKELNDSMSQMLKFQGRGLDHFLEVARTYRRFGASLDSRLDLVRERLRCLEARALAEHLTTSIERLRAADISRATANRVDTLIQDIDTSETQDACGLEVFPTEAVNKAIQRMISVATNYARADLCGQEDNHRNRLDNLARLVKSLESKCWLGVPANRQTYLDSIDAMRKEISTAIGLRRGELPPELKQLKDDLNQYEKRVRRANDLSDTDSAQSLFQELENLTIETPEYEGPDNGCNGQIRQQLEDRTAELRSRRDLLLSELKNVQQCALLLNNTRKSLERKARGGTCQACNEMAQEMDQLRQSQGERCSNVAEQLDSTYRNLRLDAANRLFERKPERCDRNALDPRTAETGDCCGLNDEALESLITDALEHCCRRGLSDWDRGLQDLNRNLSELDNLRNLTWSEFQKLAERVENGLQTLTEDIPALKPCRSWPDEPLESQRNTWLQALFGGNSSILRKLEDLNLGELQEDAFAGARQPSPEEVIGWFQQRRDKYPDGQAWDLLLRIADNVRYINKNCSHDPSERLADEVRTRYEKLTDERNKLGALGSDLFLEAQRISQDADNCVDQHLDRSEPIELDENGTYNDCLEPEKLGLVSQGRLLQLKIDGRQVTRVRGLSSLTVEFFTTGFVVSARSPDGLPVDPSSTRYGVREESVLEGYRNAYRFYERLTTNPDDSTAYYFIEPTGDEAGRKICLHVVPRTY